MEEKSVKYFDSPGNQNTDTCIAVVKREILDNGYVNVIVASTSGDTGVVLSDALKGTEANIFVVSYDDGARKTEMDPDNMQTILNNGATLFQAPALSPYINRAFGTEHEKVNPSLFVWEALERFGQGMKVCCECVMAATDGGLIPEGVEVLAVAGTTSGADTVAVIRATASRRFRELKILEILAKPR